MKAKFNITLPVVEIKTEETAVQTQAGGNVSIEVEYTLDEMKGLYELQKQALTEMPALLKQFAVDVCKEVVAGKAQCTEELMQDEDFREMREESKRREEEFEAHRKEMNESFEELKKTMRKSFNKTESLVPDFAKECKNVINTQDEQ